MNRNRYQVNDQVLMIREEPCFENTITLVKSIFNGMIHRTKRECERSIHSFMSARVRTCIKSPQIKYNH